MLALLIVLTILYAVAAIGEIDTKEAKRYTVCFILCLVLTVVVYLAG